MKLLLDLLPVLVFFVSYGVARHYPDGCLALVTAVTGPLGGTVQEQSELAAVIAATTTAVVATLIQVGWLLLRRQRIKPSVWISAVLMLLMGALTVWLHNAWFIKWKPTVLNWVFALLLGGGKLLWRRNLLGALLSEEIVLPAPVWDRLLYAWIAFFAGLGALNLAVAFNFSTDTWVAFKTFGLFGCMIVFSLGTGVYVAKYLPEDPPSGTDA